MSASLAAGSGFTLLSTQTDAWLAQIALLQARLGGLNGALFLEFNIPRMGRRIDAVLLIGPVVFVIEFKVGESVFDRNDRLVTDLPKSINLCSGERCRATREFTPKDSSTT